MRPLKWTKSGRETGVSCSNWRKWLNGGAKAANPPASATAEARQAGNGAAALPDIVSGFPRGLPDGNPHKPLATALWPSEAETFATLDALEPGRFLIGRDSLGRYIGHADDRHIFDGRRKPGR